MTTNKRFDQNLTAAIPMQWVGPLHFHFQGKQYCHQVPLATFESPLWPSVARGAKVCQHAGGISVTLVKECMTRSILLEAPTAAAACAVSNDLKMHESAIATLIQSTSRFATFESLHIHLVGPLLFIRLSINSGDASGHNMATKAADNVIDWILNQFNQLRYVSISGNFCTDKKPSSVNNILGRGKYMIADVQIPRKLVRRFLKTSPEAIAELNTKKNLIGSIVSGSIHSANAHFANMLLALYLATGQDAANIVEGSQGITFAQVANDMLCFSVTLPNLIVGTVGNGKDLPFVQENLKALECHADTGLSGNSQKLAAITAATVLCGELSLLAAQTNRGELVQTHISLERAK